MVINPIIKNETFFIKIITLPASSWDTTTLQ